MTSNDDHIFKAYIEANRVLQTGRPEMPVTVMNTFLAIVLMGDRGETTPPSLGELSNRLGISATNMSRHLRYPGDFERFGVPSRLGEA